MHRTISIKHRIVRRVDFDKAPLATFDTVDLGDEDVEVTISRELHSKPSQSCYSNHQGQHSQTQTKTYKTCNIEPDHRTTFLLEYSKPLLFAQDVGLKSGIIGANSSKKSLSQPGGEVQEGKTEQGKDKTGAACTEGASESKPLSKDVLETTSSEANQSAELDKFDSASQKSPGIENKWERSDKNGSSEVTTQSVFKSRGTIGRVTIPIKKRDSDSSSSSVSSCNEATFTFQSSRPQPSVGFCNQSQAEGYTQDFDEQKDDLDCLAPEYLDPSQILSPSKRKAFEKRIERLKVTTSPIARPRSAAPINVVTLDEYVAIRVPETTPTTPSVQDKLKITLPPDDFALKPKTPKLPSAKKYNNEDTCFEFTEEFLFSRTKSALVVNDDGQSPLSPRRVLIPPNLVQTTSPKLSPAPKFTSHGSVTSGSKEFSQGSEDSFKFFGAAVSETGQEGWAHFSDIVQSSENVDNGQSSGLVCEIDQKDSVESGPNSTTLTTPFSTQASCFVKKSDSWTLSRQEDNIAWQTVDDSHSWQGQPVGIGRQVELEGICHQVELETDKGESETSKRYDRDCVSSSELGLADEVRFLSDSVCGVEEIITVEIKQTESENTFIGIEVKPTKCNGTVSFYGSSANSHHISGPVESLVPELPSCVSQDSVSFPHLECTGGTELLLGSDPFSTLDVVDDVEKKSLDLLSRNRNENHDLPWQLKQDPQAPLYSVFTKGVKKSVTPDSEVLSLSSVCNLSEAFVSGSLPSQKPNKSTDIPPRPPSTNPFDIDYVPPLTNPFDMGFQFQPSPTNPFFEPAPTAPGDLATILDSSSM